MMKKVFALLVAVMMLLSMGAASAATNADQIGKYYEVDDTTGVLAASPALTAGNTQQVYSALFDHDADPDTADVNTELVWLNKTIAPTGTENLFDVTLEVVTAQKIEQVDLTEDAATVLVIDVSGSMEGNRLSSAKKAAQTFINTFANASAGVQRKIAIVKFSGSKSNNIDGAYTVQSWTDASSIDTDTNTSYCSAIDNLRAQGGTNIEAGLLLAENLLEDITTIKNKNIVLLTDGKPTYGVSNSEEESTSDTVICDNGNYMDGDGSSTTCDTHDDVETLSASLNTAGIGMYAVFVGNQQVVCESRGCSLNASGEDWLRDDCGFATYSASDNDLDKLVTIFENISKQIAARAEAWEVTDPMGAQVDYVQVVSADKNAFSQTNEIVTWDLKQDNTAKYDETKKTYTYTATYRIYLDTLKSGFAEGAFYPTNDVTPLTWVVLDADGNVTGADQADGGVKKAYFNVPSVQGYMADLTFKKVDDTGKALAGAEFTVALTGENGKSWTQTATSAEDGTVTITNIPSGHSYVLSETDVPDKHAGADAIDFDVSYGEIDYSGFDKLDGAPIVENVRTEGDAKITVSKAFVGVNESDSNCLPASIDVRLTKKDDNAIVHNVALLKTEDYTAEVIVLAPGWYVVEEVSAPTVVGYDFVKTDYSAKEVEVDIDGSVAVNITNTYKIQTTTATVKKVWDDAENQDGKRPTELKVTLSNGTEVTLNEANGWTATVENLPVYSSGQKITYTWTETVPEGYTLKSNSTEGTVTTLTNSYTPETTTATVKKVWDDANNQDGKRPTELKVTLSNGTEVTLNETNSWTATVENLPKFAAGKEITYTWTEGEMPEGYSLSSTTADGTVTTLTNKYNPELTSATVKKVWDDEGMSDQRPESIIVTLSNGQTVTLNDANGWTATISDLPKYAAGEEIKYTWTEADVDYYALSDEQTEGLVTTLTNSRLTGELSIYKTATEGVTLPDTLTFTVTGPEGFETRTIKYSEFTDGAYHIEGVPTGVYTVTEDTNTADVAYYELDTTNSIVDVETTVTTDGGEAKLHNEYTRTAANVMTVKVNKIVDDSDSDVPAPTEEKVFSFTGKLFRASTNDAVMLADENLVAPETAVISAGGKTFTGNLDEGIDFDFTITSKGSGTYTAPITVKVNAEDLAGLKMTIAEVDDNDSPYWYYNAEAQTLELKDGMTFEFVNAYLEGRHSLVFPITKTVEQLGNIDPGVNTFYFEVNANYDGAAPAKPVYSIEAVGDSIVQKLSDTKFSITINGAGSAKAKIVVNADNSDMPYSFTIRELAGANDDLTKEELAAKNWNYDPTALDYTIDGEPWNMNWIIQPEDDTWSQVYFIRALNDEADFADEVTFVNQYTANTPPPQTGDNSNIALWIALMGASVLCFVALNKRRSA